MSKGIEFLMKKQIEVLKGIGQVAPGKKVKVTDEKGKMTEYLQKYHYCYWCTHSSATNLPQDGKNYGYHVQWFLKSTKENDCGRFWSYRC